MNLSILTGLETGATVIDLQQPDLLSTNEQESHLTKTETILEVITEPKIGDVYQKNDSEPLMQAMIIAIEGQIIYLGGDLKVTIDELSDTKKWSFVLNVLEQ